MTELGDKIASATKWSVLSELMAKLITPISTMILARLLTPEAYGAVATTTIVISFANLLTDTGFHKYIIQHNFSDEKEKNESINTAFWTNLLTSIVLWLSIIIARHPIATFVGSPDLGNAIAATCVVIPISALSSIQNAICKRDLNFRPLFLSRLVGVVIPFIVTIPLALWFRNYWALIAGTIIYNIANAAILSICTKWSPSVSYSFIKLKEMLSFCLWIIMDSVLTFFSTYIDLLLISQKFDQHHLGLYRTAMTTSNQILAIVASIAIPMLLPTFSQIQNDYDKLRATILKSQKIIGMMILPIGFGLFLFSDLVTSILLGSQWIEAASIIGLWGLVHSFSILLNRNCTNAFIAIGKPHISAIMQILHITLLVPAIIIASNIGFETLYITRTFMKIWMIVLNMVFIYATIRLTPMMTTRNLIPELLGCLSMCILVKLTASLGNGIVWQVSAIIACAIVYFASIMCFKEERSIMSTIIKSAKKQASTI